MLTPEGAAGDVARSGPRARIAWPADVAGTGQGVAARQGTPWIRDFTASGRSAERTGSGISLRQDARPNAMDPGSHGVSTHWIRGFMACQLARRIAPVMLLVPVWPESGFRGQAARLRASAPPGCGH